MSNAFTNYLKRISQPAPATAPGVRAAPAGTKKPNSGEAPPTANAARKTKNIEVFVGLCDALNAFQKKLVADGKYEFADEYVIEFAPEAMKQALVALKGTSDLKAVPTQQSQKAKAQLDPKTNKVDNTARIIAAAAGMPIVKFIDQVMRSSSYITDQANVTIDPVTGLATPATGTGPAQIAWFKISVKTEQIGKTIDKKRNVYPMRMTYIIAPYAINQLQSEYFPEVKPRGSHKSYQYWFTGRNNAVLGFEQEFKQTYFQILANSTDGKLSKGLQKYASLTNETGAPAGSSAGSSKGNNMPKSFAGGTSQSDQGASNKANQIGASAADFLYGSTAPSEITLKILGDPAWMQQGELSNQLTAANMTFSPFNPDGTINFEAGQPKFDLAWNRPTDYNYNTGLVDVTAQTRSPNGTLSVLQPQARLTYTAQHVKSTFSQGQFTQELQANWYENIFQEAAANNAKNAENSRSSLVDKGLQLAREGIDAANKSEAGGTGWDDDGNNGTATQSDQGAINNPSTQAQGPDGSPTSNGEDVQSTGNFTSPQDAAAAVARANGGVEQLTPEAQQFVAYSNARQQQAPGDDA